MSNPDLRNRKVYRVGERDESILDLLERFTDPSYHSGSVWRISDLHLKVGEPASFRIDADIRPLEGAVPLERAVLRDLLFPLLTESAIRRLEESGTDIDAAFEWRERELGFRINAFHDRDGIACAIRVIPRAVPSLEEIGFPSPSTWREIVDLQQGLVIVTGITGSGKTTTIASLLHRINAERPVRIVTLEDPIEYVIQSDRALISQRELGRHVETFASGLRSALREDPDVILVGEMRDPETTALALSAAETGHLVLSTLHTKDTKGAITRILDMFPSERLKELATQLSFSLAYVIGQKLVPRAEGPGRRVAMEVLRTVPAVSNLIRTGNLHQLYSTLQTQSRQGLSTLEQHLDTLAAAGEITPESARRYANVPEAVRAE